MKLTALTQLAFLINYLIGHRPTDLSLSEVRAAATRGHLLTLLATRYGHLADFHYLVRKPSTLHHLETALASGAGLLAWGEKQRLGISQSGLCLAQAIVIEAIQEHCLRPAAPAGATSAQSNPPFHPVNAEGCNSIQPVRRKGAASLPVVNPTSALLNGNALGRTPGPKNAAPNGNLQLSALLQLVFIINSLADSPANELPLAEVYDAARYGRLLKVLGQYSSRFPDYSFLESSPASFRDLQLALREAAAVLQSTGYAKTGVCRNGYCLALAIVIQTIRQKFPTPPSLASSLPHAN